MMPGMSGKISDEQLFEAEKRLKRCETIIGAMTEEEKADPELLCKQGGKKELVLAAANRRVELAKRADTDIKDIDGFIFEFVGMRSMMRKNMKGMDLEAMEANPDQPMQTMQQKKQAAKAAKKVKASREVEEASGRCHYRGSSPFCRTSAMLRLVHFLYPCKL